MMPVYMFVVFISSSLSLASVILIPWLYVCFLNDLFFLLKAASNVRWRRIMKEEERRGKRWEKGLGGWCSIKWIKRMNRKWIGSLLSSESSPISASSREERDGARHPYQKNPPLFPFAMLFVLAIKPESGWREGKCWFHKIFHQLRQKKESTCKLWGTRWRWTPVIREEKVGKASDSRFNGREIYFRNILLFFPAFCFFFSPPIVIPAVDWTTKRRREREEGKEKRVPHDSCRHTNLFFFLRGFETTRHVREVHAAERMKYQRRESFSAVYVCFPRFREKKKVLQGNKKESNNKKVLLTTFPQPLSCLQREKEDRSSIFLLFSFSRLPKGRTGESWLLAGREREKSEEKKTWKRPTTVLRARDSAAT